MTGHFTSYKFRTDHELATGLEPGLASAQQLPSGCGMTWRGAYPDDDTIPVIVPRNERTLVPVSPERVRALREHLGTILSRMGENETPSPVLPAPEGFVGRVIAAACQLCRGWCCRNGHDDAFLDEATLARAWPGVPGPEIVSSYIGRLPDRGYAGSCIFHGEKGCALPRDWRSNVCNSYFCGNLGAFIQSEEPRAPTVVIAGELGNMRMSPVIAP